MVYSQIYLPLLIVDIIVYSSRDQGQLYVVRNSQRTLLGAAKDLKFSRGWFLGWFTGGRKGRGISWFTC
jgi:hypothetical protein